MSTPYTTLGVEQDAPLECIKKAYRRIQLDNHPDKTKHLAESQRDSRKIISKAANVAYEVLSDPAQRSLYDESLAEKSPRAPQPPPQEPDTPPTSPRESTYVPKPDIDPSNPPYTPYCTPGKFSIELNIRGPFSFSIKLEGRYEPYDWGPSMVFQEGDKVIILMSIRLKTRFDSETPDVTIAISSTPFGRRVTKIESTVKNCENREEEREG